MESFVGAHYYTALAVVEAVRMVIYAFFAWMLWLIWQSVRPPKCQDEDFDQPDQCCSFCGHTAAAHKHGMCEFAAPKCWCSGWTD